MSLQHRPAGGHGHHLRPPAGVRAAECCRCPAVVKLPVIVIKSIMHVLCNGQAEIRLAPRRRHAHLHDADLYACAGPPGTRGHEPMYNPIFPAHIESQRSRSSAGRPPAVAACTHATDSKLHCSNRRTIDIAPRVRTVDRCGTGLGTGWHGKASWQWHWHHRTMTHSLYTACLFIALLLSYLFS